MSLADDFRARAKEQAESSAAIFALPDVDFDASPKKQALFIVGQVNATVLKSLADAMDYLSKTTGSTSLTQRIMSRLASNDALRTAAARGDWDAFDKLVNSNDPTAQAK